MEKTLKNIYCPSATNVMDKIEEIWRAIERFKNSRYYTDSEWDRFRAKKIMEFVENLLENFPKFDGNQFKDKFRDFLKDYSMIRVRPLPYQIVENNDPTKLVLALMNLRFSKLPVKEKIEKLRKLEFVDFFVATELVALFDENYICYHDPLLEALKDPMMRPIVEYLVEHLELELPEKVEKVEDYLKLNEICKAIRNIFNFRDLWVVHEFLWHGRDTNWKF